MAKAKVVKVATQQHQVTVSAPVAAPLGYAPRHIEVTMNDIQARRLRGIQLGLAHGGAHLANGRYVERPAQVVLWLLDNLRANGAGQVPEELRIPAAGAEARVASGPPEVPSAPGRN